MKWRFVLILVLVLLSLGCNRFRSVDTGPSYNFQQGINEVELRFMANAPPKQVYPFSDFKIILEIDNKAGYDMTNGVVSVVGLLEPYFQLYRQEQPVNNLQGRSATSPQGDKTFADFEVSTGEMPLNKKQLPDDFLVKLNYHSTMTFADSICVTPDLYAIYDAGCQVEDRKSFRGQGASLAVTEMEEIILPGSSAEVEFRLRLENKGSGKVNFINLESAQLGGDDLKCEFQSTTGNKQIIPLKRDKQSAVLVCKGVIRAQRSYKTTLAVQFGYDYELSGKRKVVLVQ